MDSRPRGVPAVTGVQSTSRTRWTHAWEDERPAAGGHPDRRTTGGGEELAGLLAASSGRVLAYLAGAARLSLLAGPDGRVRAVEDSAAGMGVPVGPHGSPDAAGITAAGGRVTGAIPPDGAPEHTSVTSLQVTYHAAEVDLGDGRGPRFLRGAVLDGRPLLPGAPADPAAAAEVLEAALRTVRRLPRSTAECRARAREEFFGAHAGARFDADL